MTMNRRRLMSGIGAALLVGGWGVTRFADEPQHAINSGSRSVLNGGTSARNGAIYGIGVLSMAVGAGFIGYVVLRPTTRNEE